jgi:hypothetical protein
MAEPGRAAREQGRRGFGQWTHMEGRGHVGWPRKGEGGPENGKKKWAEPKWIIETKLFIYSQIFRRLYLVWSKAVLPEIQKFKIKYVFVDFEIRNTFPYWNFSKFGLGFELKFKESLGFKIQ